jgi:hypothetical protein
MKNLFRFGLSALALALVAGCGGGGDDDPGSATAWTVTPSVAGGGGGITPSAAVSVASGASATFTLTPDAGYAISDVGGTCGGVLNGNSYTTNAVTADCTVVATFAQEQPAPSIAACFSAPDTVTYAVAPRGGSSRVGPSTLNGDPVIMQAARNPQGEITQGAYWAATDSGVTLIGRLFADGTVYTDDPLVFPLTMQPGDVASSFFQRYTFVGFETFTIAGRTFTNACHFQYQATTADGTPDPNAPPSDQWFAPGYGNMRGTSEGQTAQFDGDIPELAASVAACFAAPDTVNYTIAPSGNRSSVGPQTFNGESVTGQLAMSAQGETLQGTYWKATDSGVTLIGRSFEDGSTYTDDPLVFPLNMQPSDVASSFYQRYTLVGFESFTLAGRTFANTCHFLYQATTADGNLDPAIPAADLWFAPGYGNMRATSEGQTNQFDGDLL